MTEREKLSPFDVVRYRNLKGDELWVVVLCRVKTRSRYWNTVVIRYDSLGAGIGDSYGPMSLGSARTWDRWYERKP